MLFLLAASLIWAFSFGLIDKKLIADLDSNFIAWARMLVALPVFLIFLSKKALRPGLAEKSILIGAVQYGCMYVALNYSYRFLEAYQVALFTILTPLYVTFISDAYEKRFQVFYMGMAILAVVGALLIKYPTTAMENVFTGFMLVQVANGCFAFGQIEYRRMRREFTDVTDREVFSLLFVGGLIVTTLATTITGGWSSFTVITGTHLLVLTYLGLIASGLAFFLWNIGALRVNPGSLAVFNNLKIPLAVAVSIMVFGEEANIARLIAGGTIMVVAVIMAERQSNHMLRMTQQRGTSEPVPEAERN